MSNKEETRAYLEEIAAAFTEHQKIVANSEKAAFDKFVEIEKRSKIHVLSINVDRGEVHLLSGIVDGTLSETIEPMPDSEWFSNFHSCRVGGVSFTELEARER